MAIATGDKAPEFNLEDTNGERTRLATYLGRTNLLLVFHPYAWTGICSEEALDLQANLTTFRTAGTEVVLVSCDSAPARRAWKQELGLEYTLASDFWPHGAAAEAYGVFDENTGASVRGTFLIGKDGAVIWSLVTDAATRRDELVPGSLGRLERTV